MKNILAFSLGHLLASSSLEPLGRGHHERRLHGRRRHRLQRLVQPHGVAHLDAAEAYGLRRELSQLRGGNIVRHQGNDVVLGVQPRRRDELLQCVLGHPHRPHLAAQLDGVLDPELELVGAHSSLQDHDALDVLVARVHAPLVPQLPHHGHLGEHPLAELLLQHLHRRERGDVDVRRQAQVLLHAHADALHRLGADAAPHLLAHVLVLGHRQQLVQAVAGHLEDHGVAERVGVMPAHPVLGLVQEHVLPEHPALAEQAAVAAHEAALHHHEAVRG
mmetsp:Transcript_5562/g.14103  ORF Transcript_5562/g.14103 Transcript_5562/m.14103 type:complete len:275 (+) Transcript_5562:278-1102(+)